MEKLSATTPSLPLVRCTGNATTDGHQSTGNSILHPGTVLNQDMQCDAGTTSIFTQPITTNQSLVEINEHEANIYSPRISFLRHLCQAGKEIRQRRRLGHFDQGRLKAWREPSIESP